VKIPGRMPSEVVEGDVEGKGGWVPFLLAYKIGERDGGLGSSMRGPGQQGDNVKRTRGRGQEGAGGGVGAAVAPLARAAGASSAFSHHKLALPRPLLLTVSAMSTSTFTPTPPDVFRASLERHNATFEALLNLIPARFYLIKEETEEQARPALARTRMLF
jgi:hypothetical protein